MKHFIVILVAITMGMSGYFVYDYFQDKAKEKARIETLQKELEAQNIAVARMASKYNAVNDWEERLSKGDVKNRKKLLTIELENVWLSDRPILFKGRIKDISNLDATNYLMTLEGLGRFSGGSTFSRQLTLSLNCQKSMIDFFLRANKGGSLRTVAVIAKINKIVSGSRKIEEYDEQEMKIGVGHCVDIL